MSEYMPEDMSDRMPEDMSEYMPEDMPDWMPEDMSDRMPDWMPEDMSDRVPEDMPDRMPEDLPDRMPEDMPEDMPDHMPEDMSDRMPEDLPVRKCINVMVGITRSKVICSLQSALQTATDHFPEFSYIKYVYNIYIYKYVYVEFSEFSFSRDHSTFPFRSLLRRQGLRGLGRRWTMVGIFVDVSENTGWGYGRCTSVIGISGISCSYMAMDQYLLIPFLMGWTSIYQLFWCSPGVQGFDTLPYMFIGFDNMNWWTNHGRFTSPIPQKKTLEVVDGWKIHLDLCPSVENLEDWPNLFCSKFTGGLP